MLKTNDEQKGTQIGTVINVWMVIILIKLRSWKHKKTANIKRHLKEK